MCVYLIYKKCIQTVFFSVLLVANTVLLCTTILKVSHNNRMEYLIKTKHCGIY